MAFGHRVGAQQDVLKEAHSDILDRAGSFLYYRGRKVPKFFKKRDRFVPDAGKGGDFPDAEIISTTDNTPRGPTN